MQHYHLIIPIGSSMCSGFGLDMLDFAFCEILSIAAGF